MAYNQHDQNSMLDSALKVSNKLSAVNSTKTQIYSSLTGTIPDRIEFENASMTDEARKKGDQHLCYKMEQWKKNGTFDIMNNITEYVTLVQLMDSVGNVNHAVSVVGEYIFDSN